MNHQKQDYRKIDILDMLLSILSRWKTMLVFVLAGIVLFDVNAFVFNSRISSQATKDNKYKESLTSEEIKDVEDAATLINQYRESYNTQKSYNDNSVYQKLNAFSVNTIVLECYVDNHFEVSYPDIDKSNNLIPIIQAYSSRLSEDEIFKEMGNKVDTSIESIYYSELVKVDITNQDAGIFSVSIYGRDMKMAQKMADVLKEYLNEVKKDLVAIYGDYDLSIISENQLIQVVPEIYESQQQNMLALTTLTNNIKSVESSFSGNQLYYLKLLVHEKIDNYESYIKSTAIGVLVGSFIPIIFFGLQYILSDGIRSYNEVEEAFGLQVLSEIFTKKGSFDKKLFVWRSRIKEPSIEKAIAILEAKMHVLNNEENVAIIYDRNCKNKILSNQLDLGNVEVVYLDNIISDDESISKLSSINDAIIVCELRNSKFKDIAAEQLACEDLGINIVGAVVVD